MFLLSNLFFPLNNLKTPRSLILIVNNVEEFSYNNWVANIREFLINKFKKIVTKSAIKKPLDYINGFLPLMSVNPNTFKSNFIIIKFYYIS
ncbi:hypothetical protein MA16_Dca000917 [Dendrobium catenatum]|uniref:Uncharacterized protein n=1 Tax=Dendrobium catenatum TaxID=906689 RepID=A0A2I0WVA0_9ASPA|nr:hypothetical protein MA16_Dca000917 [Dendrobium catenatum]